MRVKYKKVSLNKNFPQLIYILTFSLLGLLPKPKTIACLLYYKASK